MTIARFIAFLFVVILASGCFPKLGTSLQSSWCSETNSWGSCREPVHTMPYHEVSCNVYPGDFPESRDTRAWQAEAALIFHPETIPLTRECVEWARRKGVDLRAVASSDATNQRAMP